MELGYLSIKLIKSIHLHPKNSKLTLCEEHRKSSMKIKMECMSSSPVNIITKGWCIWILTEVVYDLEC